MPSIFPSRPKANESVEALGDTETPARGGSVAALTRYEVVPQPELVLMSPNGDPNVEHFRRLRTLLTSADSAPAHVIVVTSPLPGEGKTLIATNLALTFARRTEERVVLVDADLRRMGKMRWVEPTPKLGLADVLQGSCTLDDAIIELANNPLKVLPKGRTINEGVLNLDSSQARNVFQDLRRRFGRIIVDTPPVVPFADAAVLGRMADGVLMVVRRNSTPTALYREALDALGTTRLFGAVLNDAGRSLADQHMHYDRYYSRYYKRSAED
jgi:protein-tyrosine kinase